jgi:bifunctional non-homologous end joining protein LigD
VGRHADHSAGHKAGEDAAIFTRKGNDYTKHFPAIHYSRVSLPARSAIIDAEVVVCDSDGKPDFNAPGA